MIWISHTASRARYIAARRAQKTYNTHTLNSDMYGYIYYIIVKAEIVRNMLGNDKQIIMNLILSNTSIIQ